MSITGVFEAGTIYLFLLVEFLDTDILGVVKDVILVSTFFGEGIPAMRFCLARFAASTIKAVSDFLIMMCEPNSYFASLSKGSVLPMHESISSFSLTLSGFVPIREGVLDVSIGGRLTEEWSFLSCFFDWLTLVEASVLTNGGSEMEPGERGS